MYAYFAVIRFYFLFGRIPYKLVGVTLIKIYTGHNSPLGKQNPYLQHRNEGQQDHRRTVVVWSLLLF